MKQPSSPTAILFRVLHCNIPAIYRFLNIFYYYETLYYDCTTVQVYNMPEIAKRTEICSYLKGHSAHLEAVKLQFM